MMLGYFLGGLFILAHLGSSYMMHQSILSRPLPFAYTRFYPRLTALAYWLPALFLLLVNVGLWTLWIHYRSARGTRRSSFRILFWSSLAGYIGGTPGWTLSMGLYLPGFNPFGIYAIPLYSIATTYAVLQHQLFDFRLAIRKSVVYSILVTLLTTGYFALIYAIERVFQTRLGYDSAWLSLAAFALMALVFQPLKIGIQRLVDWLFFRAPHEELIRRVERLEEETRQTEKLRSVATLAAGMAHEIKNPIASIKTFTECLPQRYGDAEFREKFTRIVGQEVERINGLVQRLLDFARPRPPDRKPVRLAQLIDETVELLQRPLMEKRIRLVRSDSQRDEILVDPAQIKQVLLNLLLNSIEAMDRPGCITLSTVALNGHLELIVTDTGPGIPSKELPRVFDPFYTTKASGTGLGLSVVHSIIREHGGRVSVDSAHGRGTTFRIQLPLSKIHDTGHKSQGKETGRAASGPPQEEPG